MLVHEAQVTTTLTWGNTKAPADVLQRSQMLRWRVVLHQYLTSYNDVAIAMRCSTALVRYRHVRCGIAQHKQDTASLDYATVDMADPHNCNVYVGNISAHSSDADIEQRFSQIGDIADVKIHRKGECLVYECDVTCTVQTIAAACCVPLESKAHGTVTVHDFVTTNKVAVRGTATLCF